MKKLIAVFLLVAMTVALCACGSKTETDVPAATAGGAGGAVNNSGVLGGGLMILKEADVLPQGAYISMEGVVAMDDSGSDRVQILKEDGTAINDKWYETVDSIIADGICVVRNTDAAGDPLMGIVDANRGKELVPCEAIEILWLSDRFLLVNYKTDQGSYGNCYGSYYCYTDGYSKEYKGYGKVLDLETGGFVPGIEVTTGEYDAEAFANMIVVENEEYQQQVYKADGSLVGIYERFYTYPDSGVAMHYTEDDNVTIYGADMEILTTLSVENDVDYDPVDGVNHMLIREFEQNGEDRYCVTDLQGNALTGDYEYIEGVLPEGFLVVGNDDDLRTVDFAGNVLVNGNCRYVAPGYLIQNVGYDSYFVYDTTGKKLTETEFEYMDELLLKTKDNRVLIFETGELLETESYPFHLVGSLALIGTDVYDLITGDIVMRNVYDAVGMGSNLFVYNVETDQYTRYTAEYK